MLSRMALASEALVMATHLLTRRPLGARGEVPRRLAAWREVAPQVARGRSGSFSSSSKALGV